MYSRLSKFFALLFVLLNVHGFAKEVTLSEDDQGKKVVLDVGDTLKVNLPGNPTTGFTWEIASLDQSLLKLVDHSYKPSSNLCGAGGLFTFTLNAEGQGNTELHMVYVRPWEKNSNPSQTFDVFILIK
jgi:inhibitor of cysteine peptidase